MLPAPERWGQAKGSQLPGAMVCVESGGGTPHPGAVKQQVPEVTTKGMGGERFKLVCAATQNWTPGVKATRREVRVTIRPKTWVQSAGEQSQEEERGSWKNPELQPGEEEELVYRVSATPGPRAVPGR